MVRRHVLDGARARACAPRSLGTAAVPARSAFPLAYLLAIKVAAAKVVVLGAARRCRSSPTSYPHDGVADRAAPKGLISNTSIDWLGIDQRRARPCSTTRIGVQIGVVYNYLPLMIFPLFVALDRLDPALREASKDLVRRSAGDVPQVTLPLARRASSPASCWCSCRWPATTSPPTCSAAPRATCPATSSRPVHAVAEPAARRRRRGDPGDRHPRRARASGSWLVG